MNQVNQNKRIGRRVYSRLLSFLFVLGMVLTGISCQENHGRQQEYDLVDTLNHQSYIWRYKDLDSAYYYADQAQKYSQDYNFGYAQAVLNKAYVQFFSMDYIRVEKMLDSLAMQTNNQIILLKGDVLMMRVCQRTSRNQLFYTYRNSAIKRMKRIEEEYESLTSLEKKSMKEVEADFHIVSANYYYNMELVEKGDQELNEIEEEKIEKNLPLFLDYLYLRGFSGSGITQGMENKEILLKKFDVLFRAYVTAKYHGFIYHEGYATWVLSGMLINSNYRKTILTERPGWYDYLYTQIVGWSDARTGDSNKLAISLATHSLTLFKQFGYLYMTVTLYQALGFYSILENNYNQAEYYLKVAMDYINDYHEPYYRAAGIPKLKMYIPGRVTSSNQKWLVDEGKYAVPEWIAKEREHLSVLYTVLDNDEAVSYNRNTYLDIQEVIRQDRELENRYNELSKTSGILNLVMFFVLIFVPFLLISFFVYLRIWTLRSKNQIRALRYTLDKCDIMTGRHLDSESIYKAGWNEEDKQVVRKVLAPIVDWANSSADKLRDLDDTCLRIKEEQMIAEHQIIQNRRKNIGKRAKLNLVYSIFPLINRLQHEIIKVRKKPNQEEQRIDYALELVERINEYNNFLADWIIMHRGELSLHIETFDVQDILSVLTKNRYSFQRKGLELEISPVHADVKADKALTLFMVNTLMDNARKFTPAGGKVTVDVREEDTCVELSVTDTGVGLSEEDIRLILDSKVYDSRQIGDSSLSSQKGQGFGLMNCKGIIEKYRKTNPLFDVCSFNIRSEVGKGSCFYFRLPKGVKRFLMLVGFFLGVLNTWATDRSERNLKQSAVRSGSLEMQVNPYIQKATIYADSLFFLNLDGKYLEAMAYSDSAFHCINRYYHAEYPDRKDSLNSYKSEYLTVPLEVRWCQEKLDIDFNLLLSLRNETAIAAMHLHDWEKYYYNNRVYTQLYKLLGKDEKLADYCVQLENSQNNMRASIVVLVFSTIVALLSFYVLYFRKKIILRLNLKHIAEINNSFFKRFQNVSQEEIPVRLQEMLEMLWHGFNEMHYVHGLKLLVMKDSEKELAKVSCGVVPDNFLVDDLLHRTVHTSQPVEKVSGFCVFPLQIRNVDGHHQCIGAILLNVEKSSVQDADLLLDQLIVRCFSIIVYQKIILTDKEYENIELARDERDKARYEEAALYVQNQILDNCLSSIKHETMFYPNRIRQILDRLKKTEETETKESLLRNLEELITFYLSVYSILFEQAKRQLNALNFKRKSFRVAPVLQHAQTYFNRMATRMKLQTVLPVPETDWEICGDEELIHFLLENLIRGALSREEQLDTAAFSLDVRRTETGFVRFEFNDSRDIYSDDELSEFFQPRIGGIPYLLCKQIIREHDINMNYCGCRINAERKSEGGVCIWFTIPQNKKNGSI